MDPVPDPRVPKKILGYSRESNPGPLGWQSDVLTSIPTGGQFLGIVSKIKKTAFFALMTEENHGKNPNQFGQYRDLNSELSEYESSVKNFDRCYALCI